MATLRWTLAGALVGAAVGWRTPAPQPRHARAPLPGDAAPPASSFEQRPGAAPQRGGRPPLVAVAAVMARPTYDLTRNEDPDQVPVDTFRDPAWANAMEAAVVRHTRTELLALMPDADWVGVSCMTRTCTVRYRTRPQPPEVMAVVQSFIFGSGAVHEHGQVPAAGDKVEWIVTVEYRDEDTRARLSADDYLVRQATLSPERQQLRALVLDHFHNHPDDRH